MVNKKLAYTELTMNSKVDNIEAIWIKLKNSKINICSFYRSVNYCSVDNFIEYLNFLHEQTKWQKGYLDWGHQH